MSKSRQPSSRIRGSSITHPPGRVALPTQPGWDYLVFAHSGLFTALTESQAWTIPAHRALCVPDGTRVRIDTTRRSAIRCLYLDNALDLLGPEVRVVSLTPLMRELLSHAIAAAPMTLDEPADSAAITLLAHLLDNEPDAPLQLPLPANPMAHEAALAIIDDPAVELDRLLRTVGANRRTLERRFAAETKMSLGQWRRRARILAAIGLLADGHSVTHVAVTVGYASPSSFVVAFRSEVGAAPRDFMRGAVRRSATS